MAQNFKETAHLNTDQDKFAENYDSIDWGDLKDKPLPKKVPSKHITAGMCGEFGQSTFDKEAYDKNFDSIDWSKTSKSDIEGECTLFEPGDEVGVEGKIESVSESGIIRYLFRRKK